MAKGYCLEIEMRRIVLEYERREEGETQYRLRTKKTGKHNILGRVCRIFGGIFGGVVEGIWKCF